MEEIWKPVPGYDGYMVSNKGNVKGKIGKLLSIQKNGSISLFKNGTQKGIRVIRLMYAAFNQVELSSLKGLVIIGSCLNDIKVFDQNSFLEEMMKRKTLRFSSEKDVDNYYAATLRYIHLIMDAQATGDMRDVILEINSKKEDVVKYILHLKLSQNKDTIEDAWLHARETCIMYIVKKKYAIINIVSMLKSIVRIYFIAIRNEKRKLMGYDDNNVYSQKCMY